MTDSPGTISRAAETEPGAAYIALRTEAIALVQRMAGDVWTDYNFSDPGVTIIEQLAYALTELPYRASLPVPDLLADPDGSRLQLARHGLYPAWSILPCNPVTVTDLRRLLIDRIPGVANIWLTPVEDPDGDCRLSGLYDVAVQAAYDVRDHGALAADVRRCYAAHRALCEDIGTITVLSPIETVVEARIEIAHRTDPSDALAEALFALELALAPEPSYLSLAAWQALHDETTDIFSGPLMLNGFIADEQLAPRPRSFTAEGLAEVLSEVPSVLTIDRLAVRLRWHDGAFTGTDPIDVPDGHMLRLRTTPFEDRGGTRFSIAMFRDHVRCTPNPDQVRRKLTALRAARQKRWPLRQDYAQAYATPQGQWWDLASYTSVQTQFPIVYGIGEGGLPGGAPPVRRAQAKQLKGYLMPFDQLLADYFAQLAFVRELFSIRAGGDATYAWQSLARIVPDAHPLLKRDYETGLAELIADSDPVAVRRNDILDMLLGFLGLRLATPTGLSSDPRSRAAEVAAEIDAKQTLLRRAAGATRDRGRGIDYLRAHHHRRAMAGPELLSRIELGLLDREYSAGATATVVDPDEASFGLRLTDDAWTTVEGLFRPVEEGDDDDYGLDGDADEDEGPVSLAGKTVAADLLPGLREAGAYRIGGGRDGDGLVLVCRDARGRWWLIAELADEAAARRVMRALRHAAARTQRKTLHLVEWVLLRHAMAEPDARACRYNFRVSAVLAAHEKDRHDRRGRDDRGHDKGGDKGGSDDGEGDGWSRQAAGILRANTPAHIALDCLFLDREDLAHFERLYLAWRRALRQDSRVRLAETSRRLEAFLTRHTPGLDHDDPPPPADPGDDPSPSVPEPPTTSSPPSAPPSSPPSDQPTPGGPSSSAPLTIPPAALEPISAPAPDPDPPATPPAVEPLSEPVADPEPDPSWWQRLLSGIVAGAKWLLNLLAHLLLLKAAGKLFGWLFGGRRKGTEVPADPAAAPVSAAGLAPLPPPPPLSPPPSPPVVSPSPPVVPPRPATARIAAIPAGVTGFDANTPLTADSAAAFKAAGFGFAIRYLTRTSPQKSGDLSAGEVGTILSAGLGLMAVQHVQSSGWQPTSALGESYGAAASSNALECGLPRGICLWLDLEGVAASATSSDIIGYCNAWFAEVKKAGFRAGLYVGANCGLTSTQLGTELDCLYFWQSGSNVPDVEGFGFCMVQTIDDAFVIAGVAYDRDVVQADSHARTPVCMVPVSAPGTTS